LDPTAPIADRDRLSAERLALQLDAARLKALVERVAAMAPTSNDPFKAYVAEADPVQLERERGRLEEQRAEFRAAIAALDEQAYEKRAERDAIASRITQLDATLPLITEEAEAHGQLMASGMVARVKWLELERERITQQQELAVQRDTHRSMEAALAALGQQRAMTTAQYRGQWMAELTETETRLDAYREELAKAERHLALQRLTAPVAGTVQQIAVHTVGGVVTEAQPLMLIVPDDSPIEVEAMVLNKDIGFVHEGQDAIVKVETFNFTKYGYVEGRVTRVSRDAVMDPERGLYYLAHIALAGRTMEVNGRVVPLEPGMAVTAEVKMGRRRVIEFLLSPLLRYRDESGRER
jgi:hemolysin D